ncbi:leukocyte receptor cluster member 1 homolog [Drosophila grimshawi]|uniref:GH19125 n=1 Tax=Drosophila grimshawi TaxID=7222 RepID=B4JIM7_DROGR|nr:leukocyte receptor cluster member 1 homolog [Drosophila grimshawi]EDV93108.1 GH19125 [Drosophila grimshawi]
MNILPKKRWHVRTKDNIARVRRDEAAAQKEEKKRLDKLELAESEARINYLRRQSGLPETQKEETSQEVATHSSDTTQSVDLFADYRSHVKKTNKDLEKEKKDEQEKYEKQIGYLTYLGQDTNEALKVRSWYEVAPKRPEPGDCCNETETNLKQKLSEDPLTLINALIPSEIKKPTQKSSKRRKLTPTPELEPESERPSTPASVRSSKSSRKHKKHRKHDKKEKKHKHKSHKHEKSSKELAEKAKRDKLNRLRKERLLREATEQRRQEQLFAPKESLTPGTAASTPAATPRIVQKYNSQFNPELAKQNML